MHIGRSVTEKQKLFHIHDTIMKVYVVMDMMDMIAQNLSAIVVVIMEEGAVHQVCASVLKGGLGIHAHKVR